MLKTSTAYSMIKERNIFLNILKIKSYYRLRLFYKYLIKITVMKWLPFCILFPLFTQLWMIFLDFGQWFFFFSHTKGIIQLQSVNIVFWHKFQRYSLLLDSMLRRHKALQLFVGIEHLFCHRRKFHVDCFRVVVESWRLEKNSKSSC